MKKIIHFAVFRFAVFAVFAVFPAFGQSAVINNFTASIKGVTIGTTHCYFWGQSPGSSQVQVACYTNGVILKNTIQTAAANNDGGCFPFGVSNICWLFKPNVTPPGVDYQITGIGVTGGSATITGTF